MNQILKNFNIRFKQFKYTALDAMILRNKGQAVTGVIVRLLQVIAGRVTPTLVKVIKTTLARVSSVANSQGIPGVVKYLKAVGISTAQAIAGYKTVQTPRVSTTNTGIPRLFPVQLRRMIRSGHTAAMRLAMTLSSLYRDLEYSSEPKLGSIVNPSTGDERLIKELAFYIPRFIKLFVIARLPDGHTSLRESLVGKFRYFTIFKSSPFALGKGVTAKLTGQVGVSFIATHPMVMIRSAMGLEPNILEALTVLADIVKAPMTEGPLAWIRMIRNTFSAAGKTQYLFDTKGIPSGKLGLKQEAAGKMRVFAMVDPWTQMILHPFHKAIFSVLRKWPMDGTFNQMRPLSRAWRFSTLFSMDLTAATDRLPMSLQVLIFKSVFSMTDEEANAWREAMVGRSYRLPYGVFHKGANSVKYAVGQPMGALSSWAMLALTHHFIVQVAAWQTNAVPEHKIFRNYAVLGDDIVIFDAKVAKRYHKIMLALGVECNLSKSILSKTGEVLEFAKRVFYRGINISPTPLAELHASLNSPVALFEYKRKYQLSWPQLVRLAGFGFRVAGAVNSMSLYKLNLKVRYLMMVGLFSDPVAVLDSLYNLRRGLSMDVLKEKISQFIWDEYQRTWKLYHNAQTRLDAVKYAPLLWEYFIENGFLPGPCRKLYNNIYWAVYQEPKILVSRRYNEGMDQLQKIFWKGTYANWDILDKVKAYLELIKIDSDVSGLSVDTMSTDKHELVKTSPVQVRMFKLHKAFAKAISNSRSLFGPPSSSGLLGRTSPLNANVEPLMSGFVPLTAFRVLPRIIPRAFKNVGISKMILTALRRRFLWTIGFTGIMSLASWFYGVPFVLGILLTI